LGSGFLPIFLKRLCFEFVFFRVSRSAHGLGLSAELEWIVFARA